MSGKIFGKLGLGAALAGALALAVTVSAPEPAQAASKTGNFFLGALAGAATVAVLSSAARANRRHYRRRRVYYGHPRPWTAAWYDYCSARYRSFNPNTGYYRTYSGRYRFCR